MAKTSVSVQQIGTDTIGPLLKQAVQAELKKSGISDASQVGSGFRHFIELATLDAGCAKDSDSSFVSVVISSMTPFGWPTPYQWYHKVMVVKRADVPQVASRLIKDMWASWCNESKSSLSPCPVEEPWPGTPQTPGNRPVQRSNGGSIP
ncbi:MAG TPA: hypothetical protein VGK21_17815 [Candidatus Angelobacter sp.]